ncbi:uncharacterized protein LOC119374229 [Rhipicephalus sanguineus]|uniref:uncharacterized protein LOC119374229 n=1 Tax=Rhipicephalus sanguineus TaxID=34632 RepID=UPI00189467C6|nr:uncharacterized protein LOC119374229 [Rhipicephalus sanguineus]
MFQPAEAWQPQFDPPLPPFRTYNLESWFEEFAAALELNGIWLQAFMFEVLEYHLPRDLKCSLTYFAWHPRPYDDLRDAVLEFYEEPSAPATAEEPSAPATAEEPSAPATAEEPSAPATAEEPSAPATAEEPSAPATPYEPSAPATAYEPSAPATAYEPSAPATAYEPSAPATADEPSAANDPTPWPVGTVSQPITTGYTCDGDHPPAPISCDASNARLLALR